MLDLVRGRRRYNALLNFSAGMCAGSLVFGYQVLLKFLRFLQRLRSFLVPKTVIWQAWRDHYPAQTPSAQYLVHMQPENSHQGSASAERAQMQAVEQTRLRLRNPMDEQSWAADYWYRAVAGAAPNYGHSQYLLRTCSSGGWYSCPACDASCTPSVGAPSPVI